MSAGFAGAGEDSVPSESPAVITAERQTEITKAVKEESKSGLEPEEDLTILTKGSYYWDLSSMAPLNAVSAVSICPLFYSHETLASMPMMRVNIRSYIPRPPSPGCAPTARRPSLYGIVCR